MKVEVISYSGYRVNERPIRFFVGERWLKVKEIIKRWRDEEYDSFKVRANDNRIYILKWHRTDDIWKIEGGGYG